MILTTSLEALVVLTGVLAMSPMWALVPAAIALSLYAWFRTSRLVVAAALWITFILFESAMRAEMFCRGDCLPRVDLLPVFGILCATSLIALAEVAVLAVHDVWVWLPARSGKQARTPSDRERRG